MIHVLEVDENHPDLILKILNRNKEEISPDFLKELELIGYSKICINETSKKYRILIDEESFLQAGLKKPEMGKWSRSYLGELSYITSLIRLLKIYKIENGIS
jgi:hypothetical protein